MKKLLIFIVLFSFIALTACGKDELTFNGHQVSTIEIGSLGGYVTVTDPVDQEEILTELSNLDYTEFALEDDVVIAVQNTVRLTYSTGDTCVITFDFMNGVYSVDTFDSEGNIIQEESMLYSASEEELQEIRTWWN